MHKSGYEGNSLLRGHNGVCVEDLPFRVNSLIKVAHAAHILPLKALKLATEHRALVFQGDAWSCGFHSFHVIMEVADHLAPLLNLHFTSMPKGFVSYVSSVVHANHAMRVLRPPGDNLEGVKEVDPPSTSRIVLVDALALPTRPSPTTLPVTMRPCQRAPSLLQLS